MENVFFSISKCSKPGGQLFDILNALQLTESESPKIKLEIVGWKGKASVRAYVPKNDRIHYLRLTGGDTSKYEINKFEAKRGTEVSKNSTESTEEPVAT